MMSHDRVWTAIDTLAKVNGMTPSGLARRAGLDPTTFNRSKRIAGDGRPRWPSTESISKVLEATGTAIGDFAMLMTPAREPAKRRPAADANAALLVPSDLSDAGLAREGAAADGGWADLAFPGCAEEGIFALEVIGNSMLPHYRDGDTIIVSPTSPIRRGDRVVVRTRDGDTAPWVLHRRSAKSAELRAIGHDRTNRTVAVADIEWISRITWASQ